MSIEHWINEARKDLQLKREPYFHPENMYQDGSKEIEHREAYWEAYCKAKEKFILKKLQGNNHEDGYIYIE